MMTSQWCRVAATSPPIASFRRSTARAIAQSRDWRLKHALFGLSTPESGHCWSKIWGVFTRCFLRLWDSFLESDWLHPFLYWWFNMGFKYGWPMLAQKIGHGYHGSKKRKPEGWILERAFLINRLPWVGWAAALYRVYLLRQRLGK